MADCGSKAPPAYTDHDCDISPCIRTSCLIRYCQEKPKFQGKRGRFSPASKAIKWDDLLLLHHHSTYQQMIQSLCESVERRLRLTDNDNPISATGTLAVKMQTTTWPFSERRILVDEGNWEAVKLLLRKSRAETRFVFSIYRSSIETPAR